MAVKHKKYVLEFRESKSKVSYIKKFECVIRYDRYNNFPTLTPKRYLIDSSMLFDSSKEADKTLKKIIEYCEGKLKQDTKTLKRHKKESACYGNWYYKNALRECGRGKKFADIGNYAIEEFVPDFHCEKKRKSVKEVWKNDGSPRTFCVCCGNNIHYGDYAVIRQAKICPFCLKRMGEQAQVIIEKHKKTDPDIEDNYNISTFVAHMD